MDQQKLFKQLDEAEGRLLTRYNAWLRDAYKTIPWTEYERLKRIGGTAILNKVPVPVNANAGTLAKILSDHARDMIGAGLAHSRLLVSELHAQYKGRKLTEYPGFDFNYEDDPRVIPEKAIKAMEGRSVVLAGDVDGELLAGVKKIMVRFLAGDSRKDAEGALEGLLNKNQERATMIATTESTYSYNRGRLAGFAENRVDHVRFSAVMDSRTSPVCRSRHGLILKMDDSRVADNTPPLHVKCRSVLDPVYAVYQPNLMIDANLNWEQALPLPSGWKTAK